MQAKGQESQPQPTNDTLANKTDDNSNSTDNLTSPLNSSVSNESKPLFNETTPEPSQISDRIEDNYFDPVIAQEMEEKYGEGRVRVYISSIEPEAGPTDGETRVLVRGGPFKNMVSVYPHPKCRFGNNSMVVDASYVLCNESPIPCDDSPAAEKGEIVPLTVSLTGDFSDVGNSIAYRYYPTPHIYAFQPRLGLKDGETIVQVWGEGFLNFDELSVCNFGTESVKAEYINSTRLVCISPRSDVVGQAVPFSVSFNKQQTTKEDLKYWYYNRPQIDMVVPNIGSDAGGYPVTVYGQNLRPILPGWNYTNTSMCSFGNLTSGWNNQAMKSRATLVNSTKIICWVPVNNLEVKSTTINITLNDQQYTDEVDLLYFFKTPIVYDIDPRQGPTRGGTVVLVFGDRFNKSAPITCKFGNKTVRGKFISTSQIKCVSPPTDKPGYVPLYVSNGYERYSSSSAKYLYYETPTIKGIYPICGPYSGYTQITVLGKNFRSMGFGKTLCVFNKTIFMNATIMHDNILKCDSPPLMQSLSSQGESENTGPPFYHVEVTLDGGNSITASNSKFEYYRDPIIEFLSPNRGHQRGGTNVSMIGWGFKQEAACNVTVRWGAYTQNITNVTNFTDSEINITSPPSNLPARVVVSIALNGQQFLNDKVFHLKDKQTIYTYYQDSYVSDYNPKSGPTSGKTLIRVEGMGFVQVRECVETISKGPGGGALGCKDCNEESQKPEEKMWVRFKDHITNDVIGVMEAFDMNDEEFYFRTPPAVLDTKAIMEISYNQLDWQKVVPPNQTYSYKYYNAPKIDSISPPYGPVKSPNNEKITLTGKNFNCLDPDCKDLYVRFGDPENGIYVKGTKTGPNTVEAYVPRYTKPDVLPVEVTFNGYDYTNDNQTYGFFDPFILDVQPRLINVKGTTRVRLYGFGFVNSTGTFLKSKFQSNPRGNFTCNGGDCIKMADYIDKTTIESPTFPQNVVNYQDNGQNVMWDGMATEGCVYGNTFTENGIEIFYYAEPNYEKLSQVGSPANLETPIYAKTDFQWGINDPEKFKKYANLTCRFRSGDKTVYTKAKMEVYPLGDQDENALPTHVKCNSPKWSTPGETVKFDISVNGQDFSGDYTYTFYDNLDLYRIYPMSGPTEGSTRVMLFGSGFSSTREDVHIRWGVLYTELMEKELVLNHIWNEQELIDSEAKRGNYILKAYKEEGNFNEVEYYFTKIKDHELYDGQMLVKYEALSPKLTNWYYTHGGPIYMSVGEEINLNITNYTLDESGPQPVTTTTYYNKTVFIYSHSYVEYYYYQNPVVKKVEPNIGLQRGGTRIEVSGAWFKYKPEYGIVPHCKIGNKISRAQFHSTVRIVCISPPNEMVDMALPVYVSLNGFDFLHSGFTFEYQIQTDLQSFYPISGEEGTIVYIKGDKFMKFAGNAKYKCRFTDVTGQLQPKYEYVYYKDNTTIQCNVPKGFGQGVQAKLQVTFNGDDYSDNNFVFFIYRINGVFPNSGPSDGSGGPILILGDGFRNDPMEMNVTCKLNGTDYAPLKIEEKLISCPVAPANRVGETFPTRVDFILQIDNAQKKQDNGFWYYDQISAEGMEPNIGPWMGRGLINFYVHGLNESIDYHWANPGCKVGNSQGKGTIVGPVEVQQEGAMLQATLIQCVMEEVELVDKDYYLPATVALNSYSWVPTDFKYVPYGIIDMYPNSGPISGNTEITILGKGFNEEFQEQAYCRFGAGPAQAIVQADIVDYDQMICRSPVGFQYPTYADLPVSVPVSITLSTQEQFNPWTESPHRFAYYQPPRIVTAEPGEVLIGTTQAIYVTCDEDSEFLQPVPTYKDRRPHYDILCRFGRFKEGVGTFLNKTTIKCAVPTIKDDPESIWRESVLLSIAQNGKDFDDDFSEVEVVFVGTGSPFGFWSVILATLLIGLLIVAIIFFCGAWLDSRRKLKIKDNSYVIRDEFDQFQPRVYSSRQVDLGAS